MTGSLEGRRAFITGAARGIGEATARRFCEEGAFVALTDRDVEAAETAAASLRKSGFRVHVGAVDVTDEAQVERGLEDAARAFGGLDLVVANAGILTVSPLADLSLAEFEETLRVNVHGAFITLKHAVRHLRAAGGGTLLCTTSQAGVHGYREMSAYCASKFAIVGLVKSLAEELAGEGIRVCAVAPGVTETAMYGELLRARSRLWGVDEAQADERIRRTVPIGRTATPEEVANAFVFLASPQASYVSGIVLVIDAAEQS
ncbi:MAG TPA: SDR family NAD(P)-dependent oxidoreductase [Gaiellaceae bacterium]